MAAWTYFAILLIALVRYSQQARILGIFPIPSISHQLVHREVMLSLLRKGHEIVMVTTDPLPTPLENFTQINIGPNSYKLFREAYDFGKVKQKNMHPTELMSSFLRFFGNLSCLQLNMPEMQPLLKGDQHFDLMFLEWLLTPAFLGFAHLFQVPVIGISSLGMLPTGYDSVGSPTHPAYLPDLFVGSYKNLNLWERLDSTYFEVLFRLNYYWKHLPLQDACMKTFFGENMPFVGDLERNVSLLMANTHHSISFVRPLVPALVEIGGPPIHMASSSPKPLPQDLQEFLDSGRDGVIYFSLGSNVKSSTMPESKRAMFLNAFRKIKQKVLWKWETDDLPGKPDNVKLQKWLPQTDVLAHPNVKVFITQGGLQSMGEATHFEKPMIVIPFFADQELNAKKLESVGVAVRLDFDTITEDEILEAINQVAGNPQYKEAMKKYAELTRDQPQTPMERAVWWTEYVLRHKGAHHLRSAAVDLPWYQYFMLDVLAFLFAVIAIVIMLTIFTIKRIFRAIFKKIKSKRE